MGSVLKQFLLLGGFYFIISLIIGYFENEVLELTNLALLFIFMIMFFVLLFKKSFSFLATFQNKHPKTSNYLYAFGLVKYFQLIFLNILSELDNYHSAIAHYNNSEYISPYTDLLNLIAFALLIMLVIGLLWATYINFIKPRLNRNNKN